MTSRPSNYSLLPLCGFATAFLVADVLSAGTAQEKQPEKEIDQKADDKGEKETDADEQYRLAAEKVVGGIDLEVLAGDKWVKVKRVEKPLLYYGDPTRNNDRGSVWAWGEKGRPVAVLELYRGANERTKWACAICNTSGGKVRASRGGTPWWRANESASELKDVPGAPAPAADAPQRQRQL